MSDRNVKQTLARLMAPDGSCAELSPDEQYVCLLEAGHSGTHEWVRYPPPDPEPSE